MTLHDFFGAMLTAGVIVLLAAGAVIVLGVLAELLTSARAPEAIAVLVLVVIVIGYLGWEATG